MGGRNYRVWWPQHLLTSTSSSGLLLFGWFMDSVDSIDIVVATAIPSTKMMALPLQTNIEEIFKSVNQKMPVRLKESSTFSLLGYCITDFTADKLRPVCNQNDRCLLRKQFDEECYEELQACQINGTWNCDCMDFIEPHFLSLVRCNNWLFMLCKAQIILYKRIQQVPCLHHVHQNGDLLSPVHVHVYNNI